MKKKQMKREIEELRLQIEDLKIRLSILEARPFPVYPPSAPLTPPWQNPIITYTNSTSTKGDPKVTFN